MPGKRGHLDRQRSRIREMTRLNSSGGHYARGSNDGLRRLDFSEGEFLRREKVTRPGMEEAAQT